MIVIFFNNNIYTKSLDQKLKILSDDLWINQVDNTATFLGTVVIYFEGIKLKTTEVIIQMSRVPSTRSNDKSKHKLEISNIKLPKNFIAIKRDSDNNVVETIKADHAIYDHKNELLSIYGNVYVQRGDYIISTQFLSYKTKLQSIRSIK